MIVTRQRPKRRNLARIILPVVALALLAVAVLWPPSRNAIVGGPLKPVWNVLGMAGGAIARPFTFAAQQEQITEKNREIAHRSTELEQARHKADDAAAQAKALAQQLAALRAAPKAEASTPAPVIARATPSPAGLALGASSGTSAATDELKRDAQIWAAMDADKAAALVRKLPDDQVAAVFAQMAPDSVGPIMEALPADVAARITQAAGGRLAR